MQTSHLVNFIVTHAYSSEIVFLQLKSLKKNCLILYMPQSSPFVKLQIKDQKLEKFYQTFRISFDSFKKLVFINQREKKNL